MYSDKTAKQAADAILARLVAETDITATSPGSMAKTLAEIIGQELGSAYSFMTANLQQAFISTAGGSALDRLAYIFGLTRKNTAPIVNAQSGALFFYLTKAGEDVIPGSATDVSSSDVTIPAGTIVGCDPQRLGSDDPDLFRVTETVTIPAGSYMAYVTAEPYNSVRNTIPTGAVRYHNFVPEVTPKNEGGVDLQVNVYNRADLSVDRYIESDTNLRYRIVNALSGNAGSTAIALRLAALGVEGVRDCKVIPLAYGVGTAKAIVVLEQPADSNSGAVFTAANTKIREKASVGDVITVMRPLESSLDMTLSVSFKDGMSDAMLLARAEEVAKAYVDTLSVGDTFSVSRLYGIITSLSPRIVNAKIVDGSLMVDGGPVPVTDIVCDRDQQLFAADVQTV